MEVPWACLVQLLFGGAPQVVARPAADALQLVKRVLQPVPPPLACASVLAPFFSLRLRLDPDLYVGQAAFRHVRALVPVEDLRGACRICTPILPVVSVEVALLFIGEDTAASFNAAKLADEHAFVIIDHELTAAEGARAGGPVRIHLRATAAAAVDAG